MSDIQGIEYSIKAIDYMHASDSTELNPYGYLAEMVERKMPFEMLEEYGQTPMEVLYVY